jgi:hypothetical protein
MSDATGLWVNDGFTSIGRDQPYLDLCLVLNFDSPSIARASTYDGVASSLEAAITTSAAPNPGDTVGELTEYVGIAGALVTPVGGAAIDAGFYSDGRGLVGAYLGVAPAMGIPSASLGVAVGSTQSLAGQSTNVSVGAGAFGFEISKGISLDPSTGKRTGEQWNAGLSIGPPLSASASYQMTTTSEFTSLYLSYIQFLNWVGYPYGTANF